MWICFNDAFVSIVKDRQKKGNLLVRARREGHLKLFQGYGGKLTHTPRRDYHWRVSLPKHIVTQVVGYQVNSIDYDNFKDSVGDKALHDMYAIWWNDHHQYQGDTDAG